MKTALARLTIVCISLMVISLTFTAQGDAKIDPKTVVGIWLLDEGSGNAVKDSSKNGNNGEIAGAKWVEGKRGKGLEFDGNSHVKIPTSKTTDDYLDGFTYLLWVKPSATPTNPNTRLIERNWHNPTIQIGPADFYGSIVVKGGINNSAVRGGNVKVGQWSFVVLTFDGKTLSLYADGEMVKDLKVGKPDFTNEHDGGSIWLARWKGGAGWDFKGVIDEVAVFNVALAENDIKTIMDGGLENILAVSPAGKLATVWGDVKIQ